MTGPVLQILKSLSGEVRSVDIFSGCTAAHAPAGAPPGRGPSPRALHAATGRAAHPCIAPPQHHVRRRAREGDQAAEGRALLSPESRGRLEARPFMTRLDGLNTIVLDSFPPPFPNLCVTIYHPV